MKAQGEKSEQIASRQQRNERIELASILPFQRSNVDLMLRINATLDTFSVLTEQGERLAHRLTVLGEQERLQRYLLKIRKDCETVGSIAVMIEEFTGLIFNAVAENKSIDKDKFSRTDASPSVVDASRSGQPHAISH
jgi:hypothetical protein